MSEEKPLPAEREKCFYLTSPFIEPARPAKDTTTKFRSALFLS